ncbi:MAG: HU family DNA-binding protein [Nitrospinota bacterium]
MTKQEIVNEVAKELEIAPKEAKPVVDAIFELLKTTLKNGINIEINGFGKFIIRQKNERTGRNPLTGKEAEITSRKVVTFKPSKMFREVVNR